MVGKGQWRTLRNPLAIFVGRDGRRPAGPLPGTFAVQAWFANMAGADDVILLLLDRAVPNTHAVPTRFMSARKFAAIGSTLVGQPLREEGWGLIAGGVSPFVRQTTTATYAGEAPRGVNTILVSYPAGAAGGQSGDSGGPLFWWDPVEARQYVVGELLGNGDYLATYKTGAGDSTKPATKRRISLPRAACRKNLPYFRGAERDRTVGLLSAIPRKSLGRSTR